MARTGIRPKRTARVGEKVFVVLESGDVEGPCVVQEVSKPGGRFVRVNKTFHRTWEWTRIGSCYTELNGMRLLMLQPGGRR